MVDYLKVNNVDSLFNLQNEKFNNILKQLDISNQNFIFQNSLDSFSHYNEFHYNKIPLDKLVKEKINKMINNNLKILRKYNIDNLNKFTLNWEIFEAVFKISKEVLTKEVIFNINWIKKEIDNFEITDFIWKNTINLLKEIYENEKKILNELKEIENNYKKLSKSEFWQVKESPTKLWIRSTFLFNVIFSINDFYLRFNERIFNYIYFLKWLYWFEKFFENITYENYLYEARTKIKKWINEFEKLISKISFENWKIKNSKENQKILKKIKSTIWNIYNSLRARRDRDTIKDQVMNTEETNLMIEFYSIAKFLYNYWILDKKIFQEFIKLYFYTLSNTILISRNTWIFFKNFQKNSLWYKINYTINVSLDLFYFNKKTLRKITDEEIKILKKEFFISNIKADDEFEEDLIDEEVVNKDLNELFWNLDNVLYETVVKLNKSWKAILKIDITQIVNLVFDKLDKKLLNKLQENWVLNNLKEQIINNYLKIN